MNQIVHLIKHSFLVKLYAIRYRKKRFCEKEINGIKYNLDLYSYCGKQLYFNSVYEPYTTKIINEHIKEDMIVFDIGSSNGVFTLQMSKKVGQKGKVFSFEPSSKLFPILQKHIQKNNLDNVTIERIALSDINGKGNVIRQELASFCNRIPITEKEEVQFSMLDTYVKDKKIRRIDFIKIDTDGQEINIIKGSLSILNKYKPTMIIEFKNNEVNELLQLLISLDYNLYYENDTTKMYRQEDIIRDTQNKCINVFCEAK